MNSTPIRAQAPLQIGALIFRLDPERKSCSVETPHGEAGVPREHMVQLQHWLVEALQTTYKGQA